MEILPQNRRLEHVLAAGPRAFDVTSLLKAIAEAHYYYACAGKGFLGIPMEGKLLVPIFTREQWVRDFFVPKKAVEVLVAEGGAQDIFERALEQDVHEFVFNPNLPALPFVIPRATMQRILGDRAESDESV